MKKLHFAALLLLTTAGCASGGHQCGHCCQQTAVYQPVVRARVSDQPTVAAPIPAQAPPVETQVEKEEPKQIAPEEPVVETKPVAQPKVRPATYSRYGHADDYSWLKGRLYRVHVTGGRWKIRYSSLAEEDRWGGSMLLAPDARLDEFTDGDFVRIEGRILAGRPSLYVSGPLYRTESIRPIGAVEADAQSTRRQAQAAEAAVE